MNVHVYLNPKMKGYQGTRNGPTWMSDFVFETGIYVKLIR